MKDVLGPFGKPKMEKYVEKVVKARNTHLGRRAPQDKQLIHLCSATRHATAHPLLPSIAFGTMPHVAAYGILLVQALFFFLGGNGNL